MDDYLLQLNINNQYGVISHSNNQFVEQSLDGRCWICESLILNTDNNMLCHFDCDVGRPLWNNIPEQQREREHETVDVNMTFQAVVSVVKTVPH